MESRKIVFLYTEIASYFLACLRALQANYPGTEVHLVRWPVNKEAPFMFQFDQSLKVYDRFDFNDAGLIGLVKQIKPDVIVCSGWIDKGYLKVCRKLRSRSVTVLTLDNQWRGDLRQVLASIFSRIALKPVFRFAWVPGERQRTFALRLGFPERNIRQGFYSCDMQLFRRADTERDKKQQKFPHRFLFVGRYVAQKGVSDLWSAFAELQQESPSDWELWCVGTGDIPPVVHDKVKHFGFMQPVELRKLLSEAGVFVLPSQFEPWGVVVHEYAASGFPMICSDAVGSAATFVRKGANGYIYRAGDIKALKDRLRSIISKSDDELLKMSDESCRLAEQITPDRWAATLISMLP
jgi:glycosyltransferase involved in cell wall biosynthesis